MDFCHSGDSSSSPINLIITPVYVIGSPISPMLKKEKPAFVSSVYRCLVIRYEVNTVVAGE